MKAVNYSSMREQFKEYCDQVSDNCETIIVTRKNNRNVVILSEESYNNMLENLSIVNNRANYERLLKAKAQIEKSLGVPHQLVEEQP
ncbi:MAG: prevent-host-death protein [Spirochaetae bacterium HGW-Spirochaetae-8]|jgi:antitoxin YefM|nr:MAG: prevent-host-death protein [Spirochaetae bacterium HGW-Spirochaetae-8]